MKTSAAKEGNPGAAFDKEATMKAIPRGILLLVIFTPAMAQIPNPKIYIAPAEGFESYLAAGITKKHVPAQIVTDEKEADYILKPTPVDQKTESTGSKITRCLFIYCAGIEGSNTVSVQLVDRKTSTAVWAYNVHKSGHKNFQSSAEACAKHLKNWLQHTGN